MVWETKMGSQSIPITKGMPYGIFMKQIIIDMTVNGQLNRLIRKWTLPKPDCRPIYEEGTALSLEKMISLFIISMIGIFIAIITMITEKIFYEYKPKKQVSIKEANNMKLQRLFLKLQNILSNHEFFHESTMKELIKETQNHNDLLIDTFDIEVVEDEFEENQNSEDQETLSHKLP